MLIMEILVLQSDAEELMTYIMECAGGIVNNTLRPEVPTWCEPTWKLLMERCWASEPVERPGFSEIASDLRTMAVATHPKAQGQFHIPPPETSSR
jgi:hypothetical protein